MPLGNIAPLINVVSKAAVKSEASRQEQAEGEVKKKNTSALASSSFLNTQPAKPEVAEQEAQEIRKNSCTIV